MGLAARYQHTRFLDRLTEGTRDLQREDIDPPRTILSSIQMDDSAQHPLNNIQ